MNPVRARFLSALLLLATGCGVEPRVREGQADSGLPTSTPQADLRVGADGAKYLAHEIVVRRSPQASESAYESAIASLGGTRLDPKSPLSVMGYDRISLPAHVEADDALNQLLMLGVSASADRNYVLEVEAVPNDPRRGELWGLGKIGAPNAWDITTGSDGVVVGVVDTGVDFSHPDLVPNLARNLREIPGNGVDDDGNGFVDDVVGWDFVNRDNDPADDHGHGTHVAGTIGAVGNNRVGVVGVSWTVRMLPLKVCSSAGCNTTDFANALLYAAKMNARVVNASLGGAHPELSYEREAIEALGRAGGLLVAAAGNSSTNTDVRPFYPAAYPLANVVSVAASDENDNLASFSNYGAKTVHLAAPGVNILSTFPPSDYRALQGTSMAAPHVAGAAALYFSHRRAATYSDVKARLLGTADPAIGLSGRVEIGGRLNVFRLVSEETCESLGLTCAPNATCKKDFGQPRCVCKAGYAGDGIACDDVDECADGTGLCGPGATCENLPGSYRCLCRAGFLGDGQNCVDEDECASGKAECDGNALCTNNPGSYTCACLQGFAGDGRSCRDVDECAEGIASCNPNALCQNTLGGYTCTCPPGATCAGPDRCSPHLASCDTNASCTNAGGSYACQCVPGFSGDGFFCRDVDECTPSLNSCGAHAKCENTVGSFACTCDQGYVRENGACIDVDECAKGLARCDANARCANTEGSYTCACNPGFVGTGILCADVDECTSVTCGLHETCVNTPGAYVCECSGGYVRRGAVCEDLDECALGTSQCASNAVCENTDGGYVCRCPVGYAGDGRTCSDVDECADGSAGCSPDASCTNSPGGFVCACKVGFFGDGITCTDVDECASGAATCQSPAVCVNTRGGYQCACPPGYRGDGVTCTDVDECAETTHNCAANARCENAAGSFACTCNSGFTGDGRTCTDIDECQVGTSNCGRHRCVNTSGSFICECNAGYEWDGSGCVDVDECANGSHNCSPDATCTNTPGKYHCRCNPGFTGGGIICEDEDECGVGRAYCGEGASCKNTRGAYMCVCKPGFRGNGARCEPEDACASGSAECDPNAQCTPTGPGTYACACKPGYTGDGKTCTDVDECAASGGGCDRNAQCRNTLGGHTCVCDPGYVGDGRTCTDVDECTRNPCDANATCTNTAGSYSCRCNGPMVGDGVTCTPPDDVDECTNGSAVCDPNAQCHNTVGSYRCDCREGYTGDGKSCTKSRGCDRCSAHATCREDACVCNPGFAGDGATCVDVDECASGAASCSPHAVCTNAPGSFFCRCLPGFVGDGDVCTDVDECAEGTRCDPRATCTNSEGSFVCTCPSGFSGDGTRCLRDECALGLATCGQNAKCTDTPESYTCACSPGYEGDGQTCTDVDECSRGTAQCSKDATCANTPGSYACTCKPGYSGTGITCTLPPRSAVAVATKGDHTCAVLDNGAVRCWGKNDDGQLGYGHTRSLGAREAADAAGIVDVGELVTNIAVGVAHACALTADGRVRCWGRNVYGQLGYGHTRNIGDDELPWTAGDVHVGGKVVELAAGGEHTCALLDSGAVRCWGLGVDGQLGYANKNTVGDDESPASVGDVNVGGPATHITAGRDHTCALLRNGNVRCWGRGLWAPLGLGHTRNIGDDETPASAGDVHVGANALQIEAGWYHTCALLETRRVRCWGYGYVGQLGYGSRESVGDNELPESAGDVALGAFATQLSGGLFHTCALLESGAVRCFGYGADGRLGYANQVDIGDDETPEVAGDVDVGARVTQVAAGGSHTCALLATGAVRCWGRGELGQLGNASAQSIGDDETPAGAPAILSADVDECALGTHTCSIHATCTNLANGYSCACSAGYAGNGIVCSDIDECVSPSACPANATCSNTPGSFACTCAAGFQLVDGSCVDVNECAAPANPCQVGATCSNTPGSFACLCNPGTIASHCIVPRDVATVAAGGAHTCVILSDGNVRCWGLATSGQLGYANTQSVGDNESPSAVGDVSVGGAVRKLALGEYHSCALLESRKIRCWGSGARGQLGYASPQNIGDDETPSSKGDVDVGGHAIEVTAGQSHTCALLEGGSVRCWGLGTVGQLGYGNTRSIGDDEPPSSAGDVNLGGRATAVRAGQNHTCALMESGAVRCWGSGVYGQLGYANTASVGDDETPSTAGDIQLGGRAVALATGNYHTCALLEGGAVRCFGYGFYGALGYGNTDLIGNNEHPASVGTVPMGLLAIELVSGANHTCVRGALGEAKCWGYGRNGALGLASEFNIGDSETPSSVASIDVGGPVLYLAAGANHTCALLDGGVKCWGSGANGRLGLGDTENVGDDEPPSAAPYVHVR